MRAAEIALLWLGAVLPAQPTPTTRTPLADGNVTNATNPPFTTDAQRRFRSDVAAAAANESHAATAQVLRYFDEDTFREKLAEYAPPSVAAASSSDLLSLFREAASVAEFVHGFPSSLQAPYSYSPALDVSLALVSEFLPNMWQLCTDFPDLETESYFSLLMYLGPCGVTETMGWGLPPFSADVPVEVPGGGTPWPGGYPADAAEAADRAVYTVINVHRADLPTELYGDLALVLDRRGLDDVSVLSPVDSGDYSISCDPGQWAAGFCGLWDGNATACGQFWYCALEAGAAAACGLNQTALAGRNCGVLRDSALRGLGVPGLVDHLVLPFGGYYGSGSAMASRVAALLARAATPWADPALHNQTFADG